MPMLPGPDSTHPAQLASWRSMDAVARGDKQAWLDNFTDDAIVEDPVGKSMRRSPITTTALPLTSRCPSRN